MLLCRLAEVADARGLQLHLGHILPQGYGGRKLAWFAGLDEDLGMAEIKVDSRAGCGCDVPDDGCCKHGKRGKRGHGGPVGPTGPAGVAGAAGATGSTGSAGVGVGNVAQFGQLIQGGNNSVAPGTNAIQYNTTVLDTIGVTVAAFGTGNTFLLPAGTYVIDFENGNTGATSEALYTATAAAGPYTINTNARIGSATSTTWLHGRMVFVANGATWFIISGAGGVTLDIPAQADGDFVVRLTILKIA